MRYLISRMTFPMGRIQPLFSIQTIHVLVHSDQGDHLMESMLHVLQLSIMSSGWPQMKGLKLPVNAVTEMCIVTLYLSRTYPQMIPISMEFRIAIHIYNSSCSVKLKQGTHTMHTNNYNSSLVWLMNYMCMQQQEARYKEYLHTFTSIQGTCKLYKILQQTFANQTKWNSRIFQ